MRMQYSMCAREPMQACASSIMICCTHRLVCAGMATWRAWFTAGAERGRHRPRNVNKENILRAARRAWVSLRKARGATRSEYDFPTLTQTSWHKCVKDASLRRPTLAVLIMPNGFSHSFQQTQSGDVYSTLFNRSIAHVSIAERTGAATQTEERRFYTLACKRTM